MVPIAASGGREKQSLSGGYGIVTGPFFWGSFARYTLEVSVKQTSFGVRATATAKGDWARWYWALSQPVDLNADASGVVSCERISGNQCRALAQGGSDSLAAGVFEADVRVSASAKGDYATLTVAAVSVLKFSSSTSVTFGATISGGIGASEGLSGSVGASAGLTIKPPPNVAVVESVRTYSFQCKCQ